MTEASSRAASVAKAHNVQRLVEARRRDFTVAIVSSLLEKIASKHTLNSDTLGKVRSILSGIFTYAMGKGHFPGKSASENPCSCALIPESATEPQQTVAATRDQVQAILTSLKGLPLERAAIAVVAYTGCRPSECRGLRWEEWNRVEQHIAIRRAVWHKVVGSTKTRQSERFVTVTERTAGDSPRLLECARLQGSPLGGYIFAGRKGQPIILDNLSKRRIRPVLEKAGVAWPEWYALRRFLGTAVRMAKALGNSKAVAEKHYLKPKAVLPDVRKAGE